jgi:hypothetical protein
MKQKIKSPKTIMLAATVTFGFAASAFAQDPAKAPPNPGAPVALGLLGGNYAGVAWNYYKLNDGPPAVARGATAFFNQSLDSNLDLGVDYDWQRARAAGFSTTEQKLGLSLTGYSKQDWGKPFVTAGVDHAWRRGEVTGRHGSWGLAAESGVEFQAAAAWVVSPFVGWDRETGFNRSDLRYGARTTYRFTREWSATATAQWMDFKRGVDRAGYSLGVNYHF